MGEASCLIPQDTWYFRASVILEEINRYSVVCALRCVSCTNMYIMEYDPRHSNNEQKKVLNTQIANMKVHLQSFDIAEQLQVGGYYKN